MIKGDNGIVGVFGGSKEYTGAPYFSAISALRNGCDLSYIFCHSSAAQSIKSFAPDLIVMPFDDADLKESINFALNRIHCIIIGPGLSRSKANFDYCEQYIADSRASIVIIDGVSNSIIIQDGINFYLAKKEALRGKRLIFTPNIREYSRLCKAVLNVDNAQVKELSLKLSAIVLKKDEEDIISDGIDSMWRSINE